MRSSLMKPPHVPLLIAMVAMRSDFYSLFEWSVHISLCVHCTQHGGLRDLGNITFYHFKPLLFVYPQVFSQGMIHCPSCIYPHRVPSPKLLAFVCVMNMATRVPCLDR